MSDHEHEALSSGSSQHLSPADKSAFNPNSAVIGVVRLQPAPSSGGSQQRILPATAG